MQPLLNKCPCITPKCLVLMCYPCFTISTWHNKQNQGIQLISFDQLTFPCFLQKSTLVFLSLFSMDWFPSLHITLDLGLSITCRHCSILHTYCRNQPLKSVSFLNTSSLLLFLDGNQSTTLHMSLLWLFHALLLCTFQYSPRCD